MKILVTGAAGFVGYHLSQALLERGDIVIGVDNLNDYYDVNLKKDRLLQLEPNANFSFELVDLKDSDAMQLLFEQHKFDVVVNLAAQAGVRYSLENPMAYVNSNLVGFANILEGCRHHQVKHLVYASSSSVYGANKKYPFSEHDNVDHPVSLYAATKKSNELMAHTYSSLYGLPATGLRFFTVYGPWGRPDMAYFKFTKNILEDKPIDIYNNGKMMRDFTYITDIVRGVISVIDSPAKPNEHWDGEHPDPATSYAPHTVYNIGNNAPVDLMDFIATLEKKLGKKAIKNYMPMQPGDVHKTYADVSRLQKEFDFKPSTTVEEGMGQFIDWYLGYYQ